MSNADRMCVGTAQLGLPYGIANRVGRVQIQNVVEIVRCAKASGVSLYDTAQAYGDSEERLGLAVEELGIGSTVRVITKLRPDFSFSTFALLKDSVIESINRLNVSNLWGLLLHRFPNGSDWRLTERLVAMLKEESLIENFGVSIYDPAEGSRLMDLACVDIIQLPFNLLDRKWIDADLFNIARRNGKKLFLRSVYLQGLVFLDDEQLLERNMGWAVPYITLVRRYTERQGIDIRSFAIQVALRQSPDTKAVIGVETTGQLRENLAVLGASNVDQNMIDEWWDQLPSIPERVVNPSLWGTN